MIEFDETLFRKLYEQDRMKVSDMSVKFGVSVTTTLKRIKKLGLSRPQLTVLRDITGETFGQLTALYYVKNDKFGKAMWMFHCTCGNDRILNTASVSRGLTVSCGCYKRKKFSFGYEDISGSWWHKLEKSAVQRGYEFNLTKQEAWELLLEQEGVCALSGVPIVCYPQGIKYYKQTASLDRKDSAIGYTKENVQWVHKRVNMMKRNYGEAELIFWCTKIAQNREDLFEELDSDLLKEKKIGYK